MEEEVGARKQPPRGPPRHGGTSGGSKSSSYGGDVVFVGFTTPPGDRRKMPDDLVLLRQAMGHRELLVDDLPRRWDRLELARVRPEFGASWGAEMVQELGLEGAPKNFGGQFLHVRWQTCACPTCGGKMIVALARHQILACRPRTGSVIHRRRVPPSPRAAFGREGLNTCLR